MAGLWGEEEFGEEEEEGGIQGGKKRTGEDGD